jgi:hypothetical protein
MTHHKQPNGPPGKQTWHEALMLLGRRVEYGTLFPVQSNYQSMELEGTLPSGLFR